MCNVVSFKARTNLKCFPRVYLSLRWANIWFLLRCGSVEQFCLTRRDFINLLYRLTCAHNGDIYCQSLVQIWYYIYIVYSVWLLIFGIVRMSRRNSSSEKYVVYSMDPVSDLSSSSEEKEDCHCQESLDHNTTPETCFRSDSPVISSSSTEKWGSYWSRRERCCCFLNFVFFVALAVMIAIVILSTKGIVDLRHNGGKESAIQQISSTLAGEKSDDNIMLCTTSAPPPKSCSSEECIQMSAEVLIRMNTSADPCQDFYEFACGGFVSRTRLSWKSPRKRSYPDLILEHHLENIADLLSSAVHTEDDPHTKACKKVYQSCMDGKEKIDESIEQGRYSLITKPSRNKANFVYVASIVIYKRH
ncbi:hypothetical protein CHS0354_041710 [Potamilus streckersoni]|uniref:Peptidase M13 N-terminal domain-containing protein n=1 Tax=Potamilus streckersoni TaxID=2493646 RepID=A0AAE0T1B6_9BIVA|nr:hypothetical protein CHS0354_041710 [Potamilus streckersoni]